MTPRGDPLIVETSRYCRICEIYKDPETHHCSVCQNCVWGYDHHCPWIRNCVSKTNRIHFLKYLLYLVLAVLIVVIVTGNRIPITFIALFAYMCDAMLGVAIFGILIFQVYLVGKGLTTLEFQAGKRTLRDLGFKRNWLLFLDDDYRNLL